MRSALLTLRARAWSTTCLALVLVGVAPVALGSTGPATVAVAFHGPCGVGCPCDADAFPFEASDIRDQRADEGCPDEAPDTPCSGGCAQCHCCSATVVAVVPSLGAQLLAPLAGSTRPDGPSDAGGDVLGRIFKPPKPSLG